MAGPSAATNFLSPEDYARLLQQAEAENRAGLEMNQAPRHWTQALAGALNQGLGGYRAAQAREQNQATQADANAQIAALLQGNGDIAAAMANPRSAPFAQQHQLTAPQREAAAFRLAQDKANAPLQRQLIEAKIAQVEQRAKQGNAVSWGKTGAVFQDPKSGKYYTVQFAEDGTRKIEPIDGALTPANLSPRAALDKKAAEAVGQAEGTKFGDFSVAVVANERARLDDENLQAGLTNIAQLANPWSTGFKGSLMQYIKGSPSSDLAIALNQIQATLGFQALRELKAAGGSLGSVTERELDLLQSQIAALQNVQSYEQFVKSLQRIQQTKAKFAKLREKAFANDLKKYERMRAKKPELYDPIMESSPLPANPPLEQPLPVNAPTASAPVAPAQPAPSQPVPNQALPAQQQNRLDFGQAGMNYKQKYGLE